VVCTLSLRVSRSCVYVCVRSLSRFPCASPPFFLKTLSQGIVIRGGLQFKGRSCRIKLFHFVMAHELTSRTYGENQEEVEGGGCEGSVRIHSEGDLLYQGWLAAGSQAVSKLRFYKSQETAPNACQRVSKPHWKKLAKSKDSTYTLTHKYIRTGERTRSKVHLKCTQYCVCA
jgi:hypothetical protein